MPNKTVTAVVIGLAAVAVVAHFLSKDSSGEDHRVGEPVLSSQEITSIDRIKLASGEADDAESLILERNEAGLWRIGGKEGWPADAGKMADLFDRLGETTYRRVVTTDRNEMGALGLDDGKLVEAFEGGETALNLKLGKKRSGGGQYVSVGGEYKAYLLSQDIPHHLKTTWWEWKGIIDVPADKVKSVAFFPAGEEEKQPLTISRKSADKEFHIQGLPEDREQTRAVSQVGSILSNLKYRKRHKEGNEKAKKALENPSKAFVTLFDGRTYEVRVGKGAEDSKNYFLDVRADRHDADLSDEEADSFDFVKSAMDRWDFELSSSQAGPVMRDASAFMKEKSKEKPSGGGPKLKKAPEPSAGGTATSQSGASSG